MAGWAVTMPFDSIKTVIQTSACGSKSMSSTFRMLVHQHGVSALYNGLSSAVLRAFPANAALFLGVEFIREIL